MATYKLMLNKTLLIMENPILWPSGFLGGNLLIARAFSSAVKYGAFVVSGRSGKERNPKIAIGIVMTPSRIKTFDLLEPPITSSKFTYPSPSR